MNKNRSFIFALIIMSLLGMISLYASPVERPRLRVGVVRMCPPYIYHNDSTHSGFLIDVMHGVMRKSGYTYDYRIDNYSQLMQALQADSLDILFGCPQLDTLSTQILYSIPYENVRYKVGRLPGITPPVLSTQDMLQHKVAICCEDSLVCSEYRRHLSHYSIQFYSDVHKASQAVYRGEADYLLCKSKLIIPFPLTDQAPMIWDELDIDKHSFYSACTRIDDYELMRKVNSAIITLYENKLLDNYKHSWFGLEEYTHRFIRLQSFLRISLYVCSFVFVACIVLFVLLSIVSYNHRKKRNQMRRLLSKMPIPLYILKMVDDTIHFEYVNDVANMPPFSTRQQCSAPQLAMHKRRLIDAYYLALSTQETVEFVDHRLENAPFSVFVSSCNYEGSAAAVKTLVNTQELLNLKVEAEKNAKKIDDFLANISHEVRTPLNSILGFSQLLPELPAEDRGEALEIIQIKSQQLHKLINDILLLAKLESGDMRCHIKPYSFDTWIAHTVAHVTAHVDIPHVPVEIDLPAGDHQLVSDTSLLRILFTNLLQNALKFTHKGSIHVGYAHIGHNIVYYVQDSGIGMNTVDCLDVFNRFVKVDTFTQGTGLGMPIVLAISNVLDGHIGVHSTPGVGTTFYFTCIHNTLHTARLSDYPRLSHIPDAQWINGRPDLLTDENTIL